MRIQDHVTKLSWTVADKALYVLYGIVSIVQISFLAPREYGLYTLLSTIHSYIFLVGEGFALQGIIKFGAEYNRNIVNRYALIWHVLITVGFSCVIFLCRHPLALLFNEPRYVTLASFLPFYSLITIPRVFSLKLLIRDIHMKEWFFVNLAWLGTMTLVTAGYIATGRLDSFEDMMSISLVGTIASSACGLWLTRTELKFRREGTLTMKDFLRFGIHQATFNTINASVKQLDAVFIGAFFSTQVVGIYGSAKNLFRLFDQAFDGIITLLFPGTVRLVAQNRTEEVRQLISKAVSFSLVAMCGLVALIYLGVAEFFITLFLPATYTAKTANAVDYFKLISLSALAMPFSMLYTLIIAYDQVKRLVVYAVVASVAGAATLYLTGVFQLSTLVPAGFVVYYFVLGALCYRFVYGQLGLSSRTLLRAVPDTLQFIRQYLNKRRNIS
jgi:O-antigen/teichoic acid export membrane protein